MAAAVNSSAASGVAGAQARLAAACEFAERAGLSSIASVLSPSVDPELLASARRVSSDGQGLWEKVVAGAQSPYKSQEPPPAEAECESDVVEAIDLVGDNDFDGDSDEGCLGESKVLRPVPAHVCTPPWGPWLEVPPSSCSLARGWCPPLAPHPSPLRARSGSGPRQGREASRWIGPFFPECLQRR